MSGPFGAGALQFFGGADDFYSHKINQSLRFEDGDTASLSDPSSGRSAGNRRTWTFSAWLKLSNLGSGTINYVFGATTDNYSANWAVLYFGSDLLTFQSYTSSEVYQLQLTQVFRDPSAWYHIVLAWDTTQATDSDRIKIYVNGSQVTSFVTANYPSTQNYEEPYINNNIQQDIGRAATAAYGYDGYMAEVNFIDGQALTPTSFGETKAGIWIPKNTSGLTFGSNGYRLQFQDSSSLGDDTSGNTGNDFTSTGLAATDVVLDSPTNNWATMNPLDGNGPTISEGNLKVFGDTSSSVFEGFKGTFPMSSGKWYWEVYIDVGGFTQTGITPTTNTAVISTTNLSYHTDAMTYESNGNKAIGTGGTGTAPSGRTTTSYGNSYTDGDIIGVALDLDSSTTTLTFYKNNSTQGTAFSSLASAEYVPVHTGISNNFGIFNFGQDSSFAGTKTAQGNTDGNGKGDFYYTPPSGYLACCTANLPDPSIDPAEDEEPEDHFNTVLFTGSSGTPSITGVGFQPDFLWFKSRSNSQDHYLIDSARGGNSLLKSNQTLAERTDYTWVNSFDSDGFTYTDNLLSTGYTYVAWNWKAGGSASSNSNGSITSSVSANTEAGFSIVSYTGNATAGATVGHGLNKTPDLYIVKSRSLTTAWVTYHKDAASSPEDGYLILNDDDAFYDTVVWNDTAPTSSVFSLGGTGYSSNNSGATYIAYCFHSVDGYSKFGQYTSNNNPDGPFVYTGFRPAWVMVKAASTGGSNYNWTIYDKKRSPINPVSLQLEADQAADDESTRGVPIDFLSNGFKLRNSYSEANGGSAVTYIYLAFADQPFKYSNAR